MEGTDRPVSNTCHCTHTHTHIHVYTCVAYRKLAGKELAEDATFDLERRRNRPEKYDREVCAACAEVV